jgi:hypothetical protein
MIGDRISPSPSSETAMVNSPNTAPAPMPYHRPLGRPSAAPGARETRITLTTAHPMPPIDRIDGMPWVRNPKLTGSSAVSTAATGATTPIRPTLRPR